MNILIISPSFKTPHGGLRIIREWANRLTQWHNVSLFCTTKENARNNGWITISDKVKCVTSINSSQYDLCILTSPHCMDYKGIPIRKKVVFMQMLEHLFKPKDSKWNVKCHAMYHSRYPLISISQWNIDYLRSIGRLGPIHYVSNGVNFDDFPIVDNPKKERGTILVEGWGNRRPMKDPDGIGAEVAFALKEEGYKIIAYGIDKLPGCIPDEYYYCPSLEKINELYERAEIMIKASKYDARSCAPVEAMTKGTPTARAIVKGDDDLNGFNSKIVGYNADDLYNASLKLIGGDYGNPTEKSCIDYVKTECSWDKWMPIINEILINA